MNHSSLLAFFTLFSALFLTWATLTANDLPDTGTSEPTAAIEEQTPVGEDPLPEDVELPAENALSTNAPREIPQAPEGGWSIYVVPIEGPITSPQLYILRRALKEAIEHNIHVVLLDMDTPGGALNTTLEMMEALDNFSGHTITYVNDESISAGSYIAIATDEIWFSPNGIMGAAEAVSGSGEDINESMKRKIDSYLRAKVRVLSKEHPYRADVQRAMMDADFVFEIDGHIIKREGELLSLTAKEATAEYGHPPSPLLASGTASTIEELLDTRYGPGNYTVRTFEITWSERLAKWFQNITPVLMGIGILLLIIEMKTPGFGVIGIAGIALLLLVFASNYFAGLAGNEEILVFLLGIILVAVEIFLLPGTIIFGVVGGLMILGALIWAMADIWPGEAFSLSPELFYLPVLQLTIAIAIAIVGMAILSKLLPKTSFWSHMVLSTAVGNSAPNTNQPINGDPNLTASASNLPTKGTQGTALTNFHPAGIIDIDGKQYDAIAEFGAPRKGETLEVVGRRGFELLVRRI